MSPLTYLAIYFICWWVVLFPVLSLGSRSHSEAGLDLKDGGDPGAPVLPNMKRKFITTTWVALILFAVVMVILKSGLAANLLTPIR